MRDDATVLIYDPSEVDTVRDDVAHAESLRVEREGGLLKKIPLPLRALRRKSETSALDGDVSPPVPSSPPSQLKPTKKR